MQEGSFRCDANVSIRERGDSELGTRTEVKNVNSFRFLERAIDFEIERQIDVVESGGSVVQETRLYDADRDETRSMRSKEEANDYRYFPDPDLPPLVLEDSFVEAVRQSLPELPQARRSRFIEQFELPADDAVALTADRQTADFFEACLADGFKPRLAANWMLGELFARMNKETIELAAVPITPQQLSGLLLRIEDGTISAKTGKQVFDELWAGAESADAVIEAKGLVQISDSSVIEAMIDEVLAANPGQLAEYRAGKDKLLGFFVGQVMRASKGQADPAQLNQLLKQKLNG